MSKLAQDFLTAMGIITQDAVEKSGFDKTIEAIVVNIDDAKKGEYKISYQGSIYSARGEGSYKLNDAVHVLQSQLGAVTTYRILGLVSQNEEEAMIYQTLEDNFDGFGGNIIISQRNEGYSISSEEVVILYDSEDTNKSILLDVEAVLKYIATTNNLIISADFKAGNADLSDENIVDLNYGLRIYLNNEENASLILDINDMMGNIYNTDFSRQVKVFQIPDTIEIEKISKIELFLTNPTEGFTVQVKNLYIQGAIEPTAEGVDFKVLPVTNFIFRGNEEVLSFKPRIRVLKLLQPLDGLNFYWFKQNRLALGSEEDSLIVEGENFIKLAREKTKTLAGWEYIGMSSAQAAFPINKDNVWFTEQDFRCIVNYDNAWYNYDFTIENQTAEIYTVSLSNINQGTNATLNASIVFNAIDVLKFAEINIDWLNMLAASELDKGHLLVNRALIDNIELYTVQFYKIYNNYKQDLGSADISLTYVTASSATPLIQGTNSYLYNVNGRLGSELKPLTAYVFDQENNLILEEDAADIYTLYWGISKNNDTLLLPPEDKDIEKTEEGYNYYKGNSFEFRAREAYSSALTNNIIKLEIEYEDGRPTDYIETNIVFLYQGAPGTNGTAYVCVIDQAQSENGQYVNYPFVQGTSGSQVYLQAHLYRVDNNVDYIEEAEIKWLLDGELTSSKISYTIPAEPTIVKVQVKYNNKIYTGALPIAIKSSDSAPSLKKNTGFSYVLYSSDGQNPDYRRSSFVIENNEVGSWSVSEDYLSIVNNQIIPIDTYDGLATNGFVILTYERDDNNSIQIPIEFLFNAHEYVEIDAWDGSSVTMEDGTVIAPKAGFGSKNSNNKFTGVILGSTDDKKGLIGLNQGKQSFLLDANDGHAEFGIRGEGQIILYPGEQSIIEGGEYNYTGDETGTGMQINLTEPSIKWGSGKFSIDNDGFLTAVDGNFTGTITATEGNIGDWKITEGRIESPVSQLDNYYYKCFLAAPKNGSIDLLTNIEVQKCTDPEFLLGAYTSPFYLRPNGQLHTEDIEATGGTIGGFNLNEYRLESTVNGEGNGVGICSTAGHGYAFWAGPYDITQKPGETSAFRVSHDGSLKADIGTFGGDLTGDECKFNKLVCDGTYVYTAISDSLIIRKKDDKENTGVLCMFNTGGSGTLQSIPGNRIYSKDGFAVMDPTPIQGTKKYKSGYTGPLNGANLYVLGGIIVVSTES